MHCEQGSSCGKGLGVAHGSPPEASLKQTAHKSAQPHSVCMTIEAQVRHVCKSYQTTALDTVHLKTARSVRFGALPYLEKGQNHQKCVSGCIAIP